MSFAVNSPRADNQPPPSIPTALSSQIHSLLDETTRVNSVVSHKSLKSRLDDNSAKSIGQQASIRRQDAVKRWRGELSIQAGSQSTNMPWLYHTITRYGNEGCFSTPAREWVKKRIATEDVASWSNDPIVNCESLPFTENANVFSSRSLHNQLLAAGNANSVTRPVLNQEQIGYIYKYTLDELLHGGKSIIEELTMDFDEDYGFLSSFLILYNDFYYKIRDTITPPTQPTNVPLFWHLQPNNRRISSSGSFSSQDQNGHNNNNNNNNNNPNESSNNAHTLTANQYFQSYTYGSTELPDELLGDLRDIVSSPDLARLHTQLEDSKKSQLFQLLTQKHVKIDHALVLLGHLFTLAKHGLPFQWNEFKESQDYYYMCQSLTDVIKQYHQQQLLLRQNNNVSALFAQAGMESISNAGVPPLHQWYPLPSDPVEARRLNWVNERGYRCIQITMKAVRGPAVQRFRGQLYAVFGSGSRLLKTAKNGDGNFTPHTTVLPISNTTQYIFTMVGAQGKCVGVVPIPLAHIIDKPIAEPCWYRLRTEGNPMSLFDLTRDCISADSSATTSLDGTNSLANTQSYSGDNEVLISWTISCDDYNSVISGASTSASDPTPSPSSTSTTLSSPLADTNGNPGGSAFSFLGDGHLDGFKTVFSDDTMTGGLGDFIRGKVSKKKKRFTEDNFNLDLTYILPNIIAMGFPSEGTEGVFRNPLKQVQQFFLWRHPNRYRIYNLCSERVYDTTKFENRCGYYPFDDHNPPPFSLLKAMCEDIQAFLSESPQNVVAIHCKAGKGRTGTMIAAYLLYRGFSLTAEDALTFYGNMRTSNGHGVTIASQITYVNYFDHFCALKRAGKLPPGRVTLFLERLSLVNLGQQERGNYHDFTVSIYHPNKVYDSERNEVLQEGKPHTWFSGPKSSVRHDDHFSWPMANKLIPLCEDFRIEIHYLNRLSSKKEKLLHCWLNTRFMKLHEEIPAPIGQFETWSDQQRYPPELGQAASSGYGSSFSSSSSSISSSAAQTTAGGVGGSTPLTSTSVDGEILPLPLQSTDQLEGQLKAVCRLYKFSLDKIAKDVKSKKVDLDFHLELVFTHISTTSDQRLQALTVPHRLELTAPDTKPSILLQQEQDIIEKKSYLHEQLLKQSRAVPRHVK